MTGKHSEHIRLQIGLERDLFICLYISHLIQPINFCLGASRRKITLVRVVLKQKKPAYFFELYMTKTIYRSPYKPISTIPTIPTGPTSLICTKKDKIKWHGVMFDKRKLRYTLFFDHYRDFSWIFTIFSITNWPLMQMTLLLMNKFCLPEPNQNLFQD